MFVTILSFIIILGVIIFVHELGHFLMARRFGIKVDEFGFGFPPRLFGIQKLIPINKDGPKLQKKWRLIKGKKDCKDIEGYLSDTIYSLNWIPIGGFVKIKGEQGDNKKEKDSFAGKKIWKRAMVLSAGVFMNLVLAAVIISIGFTIGLPSIVDENLSSNTKIKEQKIQVYEVQENTPAQDIELEMGDFITALDGNKITTVEEFKNYTQTRLDQEITITYIHGDEEITTSFIPEDIDDDDTGKIGAWLVDIGIVSYPWYQAIWKGISTTVSVTWEILKAFYELIKGLIISKPIGADIAGPIGIAVLTGQMVKMGFVYILQFAALLSINLAIINFIPFPALDGGRILFLIIEKLRRKPMKQQVEATVHNVGFMILIGLIIFITFKDVSRFSDSIKGFFGNIF